MDPNYAQAHAQLAREYWAMGKYELWLDEWRKGATFFHDKEELAIAEDVGRVYSRSGRNAAVANVYGIKATGFVAWVMWLGIHIIQLIGFRNKLFVLINWAWDYFFYERAARLITRD